MSHTVTYCVRGCTRARRHASDCADTGCRGCMPRQAEHGTLCWPCHRHLELMLTDAAAVVAWLDVHVPRGTARGKARNDAEMRRGTAAPPVPIDLDVLELTEMWTASLRGWSEELADEQHITRPSVLTPGTEPTPPRHIAAACSEFLLRWLTTVEQQPWLDALYDELVQLTRDAHAHTPWAPEVRRVHGIPCPECHVCALVVYGGQADVTCTDCRLVIPEARYGIWTRMLADEHRDRQPVHA